MNLLQAALNRAREQLTRRYGAEGYAVPYYRPPVAHMKPTLAAYDCVCRVDPAKQLHTLGAYPLRLVGVGPALSDSLRISSVGSKYFGSKNRCSDPLYVTNLKPS